MVKAQHDRLYRAVPAFLLEMRESAGLTQRDLAKRMRRHQNFIYRSENGIRRVDIAELYRWAKACDRDPREAMDELFDRLGR